MKRLLTVILTLALAIGLCACGGSSQTEETTAAPDTEAATEAQNAGGGTFKVDTVSWTLKGNWTLVEDSADRDSVIDYVRKSGPGGNSVSGEVDSLSIDAEDLYSFLGNSYEFIESESTDVEGVGTIHTGYFIQEVDEYTFYDAHIILNYDSRTCHITIISDSLDTTKGYVKEIVNTIDRD